MERLRLKFRSCNSHNKKSPLLSALRYQAIHFIQMCNSLHKLNLILITVETSNCPFHYPAEETEIQMVSATAQVGVSEWQSQNSNSGLSDPEIYAAPVIASFPSIAVHSIPWVCGII